MSIPAPVLGGLRRASLLIVVLLQACTPDAVLLEEGASRRDVGPVVVFGIRGDYLSKADHGARLTFTRYDTSAGNPTGSCLAGTTTLTIEPPPLEPGGAAYLAYEVPQGVYLSGPHLPPSSVERIGQDGEPESPGRRWAVGFAVTSATAASYVGDLVFRDQKRVETGSDYEAARDWARGQEAFGPLWRSGFLKYFGPTHFRYCNP